MKRICSLRRLMKGDVSMRTSSVELILLLFLTSLVKTILIHITGKVPVKKL